MEKKLELKYLAPYLPYGLKIFDANRESFKMDFCEMNSHGGTGFEAIYNVIKYEMKPILRPMSDFHSLMVDFLKEISLIDLSECKLEIGEEPDYYVNAIDKRGICIDWIDCDKESWVSSNYENDGQKIVNPIEQVTAMLKYHLDIFGLIDVGLAIDINTLNHEKETS